MANSHEINEWAQEGFASCTTAQLRASAKVLAIDLPPNITDDNIRSKLLAQLGQLPSEGSSFSKEKPERAVVRRRNSPFDPKPNLLPTGKWGGRWHVVIIATPHGTDAQQTHFTSKWESQELQWSYDKEIYLPEPHYQRLRNAELIKITQKKIKDADGAVVDQQRVETSFPRYHVTYLGVRPGTEHLPDGLGDYWRRQAEKTNGFTAEGVTRTHLVAIRTELYGTPEGYKNPREFYDRMTEDDLRQDLYEWLNYGEFAEAA